MYDNLLQLPLFQGLCKDDFTTLIEKVKLHFITCKEGETIAAQDEICNRLLFILDGEVTAKKTDKEYHYSLTEHLEAPHIIEPYSMFGMYPIFKATEGSVVIPLYGAGLWGPIWGYIALEPDMSTVKGIVLDHKGETPGLGAEIATTKHQEMYVKKSV